MARSKNCVINHTENGQFSHAQIELDDGQVVQGRYELFHWDRPPQNVLDQMEAAVRSGPVQTLDLRK